MVDIETLLPHPRTPQDYLNLITDPRIDQEVLRALAGSTYPFVRLAVARHHRTHAALLAQLVTTELNPWDRNHLLETIAKHPQANRAVLIAVLQQVTALLNQPNARPYAAALALAQRDELHADEILVLTRQPGASRRMRRGVRRHLTAREHEPGPTGHASTLPPESVRR